MAYYAGYKVDFRSGGDTVSEAFSKHISEITKIYGILNELKDNDLTPAELETLKNGTINGNRVTGTLAGYVEGSHVTGNIAASQVSGALTNATIPSGKVTGLEALIKSLNSSSGVTESGSNYVKFGNGLIIQSGSMDLIGSSQELDITFSKAYSASPCVILSGETAGSEEITVTLRGRPSKTGFSVIFGQSAGNISKTVNYIAIGV